MARYSIRAHLQSGTKNRQTQIAGALDQLVGAACSARSTCPPTRNMRRSTSTPYGSDISCFGALASIDAHGWPAQCPLFSPVSLEVPRTLRAACCAQSRPELRQQRRQRQQQRQKRCRFAGFHGGRVSATIVVSVCMLSLLSVAVGANGLGQARSTVACLARLLADASQAGCRRAASSTKAMLSSRLLRTARPAVELL